jgi:hypothetical protein
VFIDSWRSTPERVLVGFRFAHPTNQPTYLPTSWLAKPAPFLEKGRENPLGARASRPHDLSVARLFRRLRTGRPRSQTTQTVERSCRNVGVRCDYPNLYGLNFASLDEGGVARLSPRDGGSRCGERAGNKACCLCYGCDSFRLAFGEPPSLRRRLWLATLRVGIVVCGRDGLAAPKRTPKRDTLKLFGGK